MKLIHSAQILAGRAMVGWSQVRLAEESGVNIQTVKRLEGLRGMLSAHVDTIRSIEQALDRAGIEFLADGAPGVRLKPGIQGWDS